MDDLEQLRVAVRAFSTARDWQQFHAPKNLAMALAVEAAELMEPFQWLGEDASRNPDAATRAAVRDEMADVLIYLVRLADQLDVDLLAAAADKLERNARKYPVELARGNARKYTQLDATAAGRPEAAEPGRAPEA